MVIDTACNEESIFVQRSNFTDGQDPHVLMRCSRLTSTRTRGRAGTGPSPGRLRRPDTGKIAVKVINDYGDEVMKNFAV